MRAKFKWALFAVLLGALFGCSTVPKETPKGRAIVIVKGKFTETCIQVGRIKYDGTPFIHEKQLMIIMKENAAKLGGNALRLDKFMPGVTGVSNAKGIGTSFKCKVDKLKEYVKRVEAAEFGETPAEDEEGSTDETASEEVSPSEETGAATPKEKTKMKAKAAKPAAGTPKPSK